MTSDQLKGLKSRVEALRGYLDYDVQLREVAEEESITTKPDFWNDPKEAEKILFAIKGKKIWTDHFKKVLEAAEEVDTLSEFLSEGEGTVAEVDKAYQVALKVLEELEFRRMLSGEEDQLSAMMEINPGAGGT